MEKADRSPLINFSLSLLITLIMYRLIESIKVATCDNLVLIIIISAVILRRVINGTTCKNCF